MLERIHQRPPFFMGNMGNDLVQGFLCSFIRVTDWWDSSINTFGILPNQATLQSPTFCTPTSGHVCGEDTPKIPSTGEAEGDCGVTEIPTILFNHLNLPPINSPVLFNHPTNPLFLSGLKLASADNHLTRNHSDSSDSIRKIPHTLQHHPLLTPHSLQPTRTVPNQAASSSCTHARLTSPFHPHPARASLPTPRTASSLAAPSRLIARRRVE